MPENQPVGSAETAEEVEIAARRRARTIITTSCLVVWVPALLLFGVSGNPIALLIPVMGYCPVPNRSGDPGYSLHAAYIWGVCLLTAFALLGICAITRKSVQLATLFAVLLAISVFIDLIHLGAAANTPVP